MPEAWYSPEELKAEVDGLRRQPEFPLPDPEVYEGPVDYPTEDDTVAGPVISRLDEIAAIVATFDQ